MNGLEATDLLDLWERGLTQSLPRRADALLRAAWPDAAEGDVCDWPLGLRDARLLALRRWLFGPDITVLAACPSCGETVESTFRVDDVLLPPEASPASVPASTEVIERHGLVITFRLPTGGDLIALAEAPAGVPLPPRDRLLARCVLDVRDRDGLPEHAGSVPVEVGAEIATRMAAADPQADLQLACRCPACGGGWAAIFDIAVVLWSEIHGWARQLLRDVHALGRAYGWREPDVLALSPTRRGIYLELLGS
jgi:hypothetical protein